MDKTILWCLGIVVVGIIAALVLIDFWRP